MQFANDALPVTAFVTAIFNAASFAPAAKVMRNFEEPISKETSVVVGLIIPLILSSKSVQVIGFGPDSHEVVSVDLPNSPLTVGNAGNKISLANF